MIGANLISKCVLRMFCKSGLTFYGSNDWGKPYIKVCGKIMFQTRIKILRIESPPNPPLNCVLVGGGGWGMDGRKEVKRMKESLDPNYMQKPSYIQHTPLHLRANCYVAFVVKHFQRVAT